MSLCEYADIFGKPNEGLHSYRIFDIAIIDVIATLIIAGLLNMTIGKNINLTFLQILCILFLLGIIFHRLFCVHTTIDKLLFD